MNSLTKTVEPSLLTKCDARKQATSKIPDYLQEVYHWAYLDPRNAYLLDRELIVNTILWGNSKRLRQAVLNEVKPGSDVLQAAHVYGRLIPELAKKLGNSGSLEVIDIAPLQASLCKKKLKGFSFSSVLIADASSLDRREFDLVDCFFLLHEVPDELKTKIVNELLSKVKLEGKAVFVDYHKPNKWHPLRKFMQLIFRRLEPFAESLWYNNIEEMAERSTNFKWQKRTIFGGLYQIVIATRSI